MDIQVRDARDADADALIRLVDVCWSAYPGCVLDVDGEVPELRAIASHFAARDGRFWVAEVGSTVVGCVGVAPSVAGHELLKLYVDPAARKQGLGAHLAGLVEEAAHAAGSSTVELWSDTRFIDAHRLYERLGYRKRSETRALGDLSATVEFHYVKPLG